MSNSATPWTVAHRPPCPLPSLSLPEFVSIESVMTSNQLILCCSLLLPSIFPSIEVFSNELALHITWPKYFRFSFSISPSRECSRLISFGIHLVWSPCYLRVYEESSPAPQLESINSSVLSLLLGTIITSIHDFWKDHNLDYMDFCQQNDIFAP